MRIYYATKTGRGAYCGMYGKGRCARCHKILGKGFAPLIRSDNLGAGVVEYEKKSTLTPVVSKLSKLSLGPKKNNIRFDI
jgi:mono/diheme cytochrome c family protein